MTEHHPHRVVVGYDGSGAARAALRYALEHADAVTVVHAYSAPVAAADWTTMPYYADTLEAQEQRAATMLDDLPEAATADVPLERRVVQGTPADALVAIAREHDADEIVVGCNNHGTLRAALTGSVSHSLLQVADRPVVIVPACERKPA